MNRRGFLSFLPSLGFFNLFKEQSPSFNGLGEVLPQPRYKLGDKITYDCYGLLITGIIMGIDIDRDEKKILYRVDEFRPDGSLLRDSSWFDESDIIIN